MNNLTEEQKEQFSKILENLSEELDISESRYNELVSSYKAVGSFLGENETLASLKPEIHPQGSFLLGTMIKPVNDNDDLDIDLVCEFKSKYTNWTAKDLKETVGKTLKNSERYGNLLDDEGRRCWTLLYRKNSDDPKDKYHLDILPCVYDKAHNIRESFSRIDISKLDELAIRITDRDAKGYDSDSKLENWMKSNPFGYAKWFDSRCTMSVAETRMLSEATISPVPKYHSKKTILQRVVQILKRHRDIMFGDDKYKKDKPISIIITTLAAKAYNGESDLLTALHNVVTNMEFGIELRGNIEYVDNPVNINENFADKWISYPLRKDYFHKWLNQVKKDILEITTQKGLSSIAESMQRCFGDSVTNNAFENLAAQKRQGVIDRKVKVASTTGVLGSIGTTIKAHNFYGE